MGELSKPHNSGSALEAQLNRAGIHSADELAQAGAEQAWLAIQRFDPSACVHRLLALEGAIQGVRKTALPEQRRRELRAFYQEHRK